MKLLLFTSGPDEADLYKVDIPGTNMHAYEK